MHAFHDGSHLFDATLHMHFFIAAPCHDSRLLSNYVTPSLPLHVFTPSPSPMSGLHSLLPHSLPPFLCRDFLTLSLVETPSPVPLSHTPFLLCHCSSITLPLSFSMLQLSVSLLPPQNK